MSQYNLPKSIKSFILPIIPKLIVFGIALLNFIFIWNQQKVQTSPTFSFCMYCSWYETWSFTNAPSIILLAAFLLLFSKRWSYIFASALSGYVVFQVLFYLIRSISYFGLSELWEGLQKSESRIFLVWETQLVWAGIVFSFTIFYLLQNILHKNTSQNKFL